MSKDPSVVTTDDTALTRARDFRSKAREYWAQNHETGREDLRFARLSEQWHKVDRDQRERDKRPCETFNKMKSFIRQVVNDARQNKPAIKVHAADDKADPETAEIINGLIRNIEVISNADAAYDTGIESACDKGFGYWKVNVQYACDDTFEKDIIIERVANSFTVLPDYRSVAVDGSDWNEAIIETSVDKDEFKREYPDAEMVDWEHDFSICADWMDGDNVIVAEYWTREKVKSQVALLSDGTIRPMDEIKPDQLALEGVTVVGPPRDIESYKVTQYICSGAEVLKETEWAGRFIPIVPVYGDEVIDETGKRLFFSLIHDAKGAQRMYNYMRNTGIEMVGLAPKAPWVGKKGTFDSDPNWDTANTQSHSYLEYDGEAPQRNAGPIVAPGVIQETLTASDDMKAIIGLHDASLGIRSNETSGVAIKARQLEGDTATFHFGDNQNRAIRYTGLILIDLIPHVYSSQRIVRVLGEDMKPRTIQIGPSGQAGPEQPNMPPPQMQGPMQADDDMLDPAAVSRVYDLTVGKYDLTVSSGPAFASRRDEANDVMTEVVRAYPPAAPILAPRIMKNLDIPDADEIAQEFDALNPAKIAQQHQQGLPPEVQQQMQQGMQMIQQQGQQIQALTQQLADKQAELSLKARELDIKGYEAETDRQKQENDARANLMKAIQPANPGMGAAF